MANASKVFWSFFFTGIAMFWAFMALVFAETLGLNWHEMTTLARIVVSGFAVVMPICAWGTFLCAIRIW